MASMIQYTASANLPASPITPVLDSLLIHVPIRRATWPAHQFATFHLATPCPPHLYPPLCHSAPSLPHVHVSPTLFGHAVSVCVTSLPREVCIASKYLNVYRARGSVWREFLRNWELMDRGCCRE